MNRKPWTEQEFEALHRLYPIGNMADLLKALPDRTPASIQTKARDLGIRKTNDGRSRCMVGCRSDVNYWTQEEDDLLRELWKTVSIRAVYAEFEGLRSKRSIRYRVQFLKLKRPPEIVSKIRSEVARKGAAGRIKVMKAKAAEEAKKEIDALKMVQEVIPAAKAKAVNLSKVLAHPLEAAWRGVL